MIQVGTYEIYPERTFDYGTPSLCEAVERLWCACSAQLSVRDRFRQGRRHNSFSLHCRFLGFRYAPNAAQRQPVRDLRVFSADRTVYLFSVDDVVCRSRGRGSCPSSIRSGSQTHREACRLARPQPYRRCPTEQCQSPIYHKTKGHFVRRYAVASEPPACVAQSGRKNQGHHLGQPRHPPKPAG